MLFCALSLCLSFSCLALLDWLQLAARVEEAAAARQASVQLQAQMHSLRELYDATQGQVSKQASKQASQLDTNPQKEKINVERLELIIPTELE